MTPDEKELLSSLKKENKNLKKEITNLNKTIENIKKILKEKAIEAKNLMLKRKLK